MPASPKPKKCSASKIFTRKKESNMSIIWKLPSKPKLCIAKTKNTSSKTTKIIIVDEFTGRLQPGRRWSEGLHQAIEAKENVPIQKESKTFASITYQNYFRLYPKIAGMTGTAQDFGRRIPTKFIFLKSWKCRRIGLCTS